MLQLSWQLSWKFAGKTGSWTIKVYDICFRVLKLPKLESTTGRVHHKKPVTFRRTILNSFPLSVTGVHHFYKKLEKSFKSKKTTFQYKCNGRGYRKSKYSQSWSESPKTGLPQTKDALWQRLSPELMTIEHRNLKTHCRGINPPKCRWLPRRVNWNNLTTKVWSKVRKVFGCALVR